MKRVKQQLLVRISMMLLLMILSGPLQAQIYKIVDENGNVTFTDQPPAEGSKPIKLRPISVIEAPTYEKSPRAADEDFQGGDANEMSLKEMRRNYRDFAITAPRQEESIWNPEQAISVAWSARNALQKGMTVSVFMDGREQATITEQVIKVADLERGEHVITAELKDAKRRTIATATPVTFFIRRPGLFNRANIAPNGG